MSDHTLSPAQPEVLFEGVRTFSTEKRRVWKYMMIAMGIITLLACIAIIRWMLTDSESINTWVMALVAVVIALALVGVATVGRTRIEWRLTREDFIVQESVIGTSRTIPLDTIRAVVEHPDNEDLAGFGVRLKNGLVYFSVGAPLIRLHIDGRRDIVLSVTNSDADFLMRELGERPPRHVDHSVVE